ncbi:MAG: NAD(P)-dependent oxidoreductase [Bdellovibrionaceae bacterium]|nr:NAD(P)-dependent oxidoreductase [Pseudobdellovibrionaceae bacterium]
MKKVFITGADGFLGRKLGQLFLKNGWIVFGAVRKLENNVRLLPNVQYIEIKIDSIKSNLNLPGEIDTIIHCAWKYNGSKSEIAAANAAITDVLVNQAKTCQARLIFISSLAAHENALSAYGKTKYACEKIAKGHTTYTILRPGTIVGNGGLFLKTIHLLKKIPIVPLFYGGKQPIQLIGIDSLCQAIFFAADKDVTGTYTLACYPGIKLYSMYQMIAHRFGLKRFFIKMPSDIILNILLFLESLRMRLPITSDNILGLKGHHEVNSEKDWRHFQQVSKSAHDILNDFFNSNPGPTDETKN